jgi:secreted trypsin-like serine protease
MIGTINRVRGPHAQVFDVSSTRDLILHPHYDPNDLSHDIAMIRLRNSRENILAHPHVDLIQLPSAVDVNSNLVGMNGTVSGFGVTSDSSNRSPSEELRFVSMPIMSNARCALTFGPFIRNFHLCVDTIGSRSPCQGDSGANLSD